VVAAALHEIPEHRRYPLGADVLARRTPTDMSPTYP
jgi:hypothetical protein